MTPKITQERFQKFILDFHAGDYSSQRFGQAFVNEFSVSYPCGDIYYEANYHAALALIQKRYILGYETEEVDESTEETSNENAE